MAERSPTSTIPEALPLARLRRARALRRLAFVVIALFLLAAAFGLLGVRSREASASGGGYDMTVTYAAMSRPGLATPFDIEVTKAGGFPGQVTLAVSGDYLAAFDENGLDPDPTGARADGDFVYWTFDPPEGDVLLVSFDARLEPAVQWKREGTVRLIRQSEALAEIDFTTWVMP